MAASSGIEYDYLPSGHGHDDVLEARKLLARHPRAIAELAIERALRIRQERFRFNINYHHEMLKHDRTKAVLAQLLPTILRIHPEAVDVLDERTQVCSLAGRSFNVL